MTYELAKGVSRFQQDVFPDMRERFEELAGGQSPKALFITCSDSRIDPNMLTGTLPGELFVIRNAGNIIPRPDSEPEGVLATIEYAVQVLNVPEIVVCGHSQCGAMGGLLSLDSLDSLPMVKAWIQQSQDALKSAENLEGAEALWQVTLANVCLQMERLKSLPGIQDRIDQGALAISGWCYEFEKGEVVVYRPETEQFESLKSISLS